MKRTLVLAAALLAAPGAWAGEPEALAARAQAQAARDAVAGRQVYTAGLYIGLAGYKLAVQDELDWKAEVMLDEDIVYCQDRIRWAGAKYTDAVAAWQAGLASESQGNTSMGKADERMAAGDFANAQFWYEDARQCYAAAGNRYNATQTRCAEGAAYLAEAADMLISYAPPPPPLPPPLPDGGPIG